MGESRTDINIWHSADLQAELLRGRFINYAYDVHTHDTACFALLTHGSIRIKMKGNEFVVSKGDLYAIDADEPHAGWAIDEQGWQLRTLYVDMGHLRQAVHEQSRFASPGIAGPIIHDKEVADWFSALHLCSESEGSRLFRDQAYLMFADKLLQRHVRQRNAPVSAGKENKAVYRAREFLDAHLGDNVSLIALAEKSGLPQYKLFRAFAAEFGMTPHEYQRQARIRYAIHLIRKRHTLSEASMNAGFADQAHFSRWFKRFMGVTPGQYQQALG